MLPDFLRDRVLPSTDPHEIRLRLIRDVMETADCDFGACYRTVKYPDETTLRVFGIQPVGGAVFDAVFAAAEGVAIMSYHGLESITSSKAFEVQRRGTMPAAFVERFWDPPRIRCCVGTNVLDDGGRHVAWIGGFRSLDRPEVPKRAVAQLNERRPAYQDMLVTAHRLEVADPDGATLVIAPDGRVLAASEHASAWLSTAGFDALLDAVARDDVRSTFFRSASVTMCRVDGEIGPALVVTIAPRALLRLPTVMTLSRARRRVAALAGLGLTVPEIAAELGRGAETVRTHLNAVYEGLGIACRAELATALSEMTG